MMIEFCRHQSMSGRLPMSTLRLPVALMIPMTMEERSPTRVEPLTHQRPLNLTSNASRRNPVRHRRSHPIHHHIADTPAASKTRSTDKHSWNANANKTRLAVSSRILQTRNWDGRFWTEHGNGGRYRRAIWRHLPSGGIGSGKGKRRMGLARMRRMAWLRKRSLRVDWNGDSCLPRRRERGRGTNGDTYGSIKAGTLVARDVVSTGRRRDR